CVFTQRLAKWPTLRGGSSSPRRWPFAARCTPHIYAWMPTPLAQEMDMDIGIIGSGNIGSTLARHLKGLGHQVSIANSRGPASLAALAAETDATAVTVEQAARAQDLVIITVPQKAVPQLPRDSLATSSAVVVDTGNYYPSRDGRIAEIDGGL